MIEFVLKNRKLRLHPDGIFYVRAIWKGEETKDETWNQVTFSPNTKGYLKCGITMDGKLNYFKKHRLVYYAYNQDWDIFDGSQDNTIDHRNGNITDNRIENLKNVTAQENAFNTNARGYSWCKRQKKWVASIMVSGFHNHLGYFETEEEAATAYKKAKEELHVIIGNPRDSRSQGRQGGR